MRSLQAARPMQAGPGIPPARLPDPDPCLFASTYSCGKPRPTSAQAAGEDQRFQQVRNEESGRGWARFGKDFAVTQLQRCSCFVLKRRALRCPNHPYMPPPSLRSGRLSQKLRGIDQEMSMMLLPAGSLERGNLSAAASPVLSPVPSTGRPGDVLLGQGTPASLSRTAGQR